MKRKRAILMVFIASVLWSTGGLFIKLIDWNPIAITGARSGISAIVILVFWLVKYKEFLPRPNRFVVLASVNYTILVLLFVVANKYTTAANAILLQFTAPIWVLVIGRVFYRESFHRVDLICVFIVISGMILFFVGDLDSGGLFGNILAILSGISFAIMILNLNKMRKHRPIEVVFWGNILAFVVSFPFYSSVVIDLPSSLAISFMGVFQLGLAYVLFSVSIQSVTPIDAILIPVVEPLLNPIWVLIVTHEKPSSFAVLGGLVIVGSVVWRNYWFYRYHISKE